MIDLRFATTLQMMLSLALARKMGVPRLSSSQLAAGSATNASMVRRLVSQLAEAGLVTSTSGRSGGVTLARPAGSISLREIHAVTLGSQPLWRTRADIPHQCVVSSNMDDFFRMIAGEAESAALETLARRSLADALADLERIAEEKGAVAR